MDTPLRFRYRHALNTMRSGFKFEFGKNILAGNFGRSFLITAERIFVRVQNLKLPAHFLRIALIHFKQHRCKQSRFVAAGARAHFKDGVFFVVLFLGQEQDFNFLFHLGKFVFQLIVFGRGHFAHFFVQRIVFHHRLGIVQVIFGTVIVMNRFHHRRQFGNFLVHAHQIVRTDVRRRQQRLNFIVAVDNIG